ncbi:DoxX family protein [Gammaproteobacteria bacterium LSUCC0057]|uniref:DoxX family protein n=1 Tax=Gammaproteobacteria bacterium LSUCC0057 TaxID=2559237 RepID=A0A4Y8UI87_9GAMM|nr:DoxX family protein [Gammaproteobacteria bacterium LSUCC0057]
MNLLSAKTLYTTAAGYDALALRLVAGAIFIAHGAQKLFGWFGGGGLEKTGQWMASIGLEPGYLMALLAGGAEFFGGLLLVVGLLTRPAALACAFTMLVATVVVHLDNGFFARSGGYEFSLALLAMSVALLLRGAGSCSVDAQLAQRHGD